MQGLTNFNRILFVNSYACNMNCPYCMHTEHKKNKRITSNMQFGLEPSKKIFEELISQSKYKKLQVTFSGGEPMVFYKKYLKPFILYMNERMKTSDKELVIDMFTNGSLLTEEAFYFFKENKVMIGFSYDGDCGQKFRNKEMQKKIEDNIRLGLQIMPELISVASTFYSDTLRYMVDAYETMLKMNVPKWSFAIDTLSEHRYSFDEICLIGDQIKEIWELNKKHKINIGTFDRVKNFADYAENNRAIICRPDGEICLGTTIPILIHEKIFPLLSLGYWTIDNAKLELYTKVLGDFHIHVMGKNEPRFCKDCKVKESCQTEMTIAEKTIREEADPLHCLFYLIISKIMEDSY